MSASTKLYSTFVMKTKKLGSMFLRSVILANLSILAFSAIAFPTFGQTGPNQSLTVAPLPSPTPTPEPTSAQTEAKPAQAAPASTDYWSQPYLTGDWEGARSRWKEKGVDLQFRLTQGYQVRATDSILQGDADGFYAGKFDTNFIFDLTKLGWIKGMTVQMKTETRFGRVAGGSLAIIPHTAYGLTPLPTGTAFSITALNFTQLIPLDLKKGNLLAFGAGKYYSLDNSKEPFNSGSGHSMFMNTAFNAAPATGQLVPTITNGATFAWIKGGNPFITAAVFDATGSPTKPGLRKLGSRGVTFVSGINLYSKFGGKSGKHSFSGAVTTRTKTPFDRIVEVVIPGFPPELMTRKKGSWTLTYAFYQYLVERPVQDGEKKGWGVFGYAQKADNTTNPLSLLATVGVGGNGLFKGRARSRDRFGIGYAYVGISSVLKREIRPIVPIPGVKLENEHIFETFYNFSITPFLSLTGNLQVVDPTVNIAKTAIIPGARLVINF